MNLGRAFVGILVVSLFLWGVILLAVLALIALLP